MKLTFPLPARALSINEERNLHWAQRNKRLRPWRDALGWTWKAAPKGERDTVVGRPLLVRMTIPFDVTEKQWDGTRRDGHNFTGTVVKACVDEIVALQIVPDDTPEWVTVSDPILVRGSEVVVELIPRSQ